MHYLPGARRVAGFLLIGLLAGCSGGNGGDEAAPIQLSTNAITFRAWSPGVGTAPAAPAAQTFTATFAEDIAHLAVVHSGDAISMVTSSMNGRSAQVEVFPANPETIGPGNFAGAVAVTGYTCADATCTRLSAGGSATVAVSFQVSPVIQRVAPYVATAGAAETVVLRGSGFRAFNVTGVRFGDTAATEFTVNRDGTEIAATHPALAAGTYTVRLEASNHEGELPSNVSLLVLDPIAYAATTLAHLPGTNTVRSLSYDAERRALLVVTDAPPNGPVVRYAYENGAWAAPTVAANGFVDAALSADGSQIFGITSNTLVPLDPVTLALGTAVTAPSLEANSALKNIVVGNDNRGLVTTSLPTSGTTAAYIYDPQRPALLVIRSPELNNGTPAMAANGSAAVVVQGDPTLTSDVDVYGYSTSSNSLSTIGQPLRQNDFPPAVNRSISRVVLNGLRVYDGALALLGTLPNTTAALVLKPDGSRVYAYDTTAGGILVYDVSVDRDEAAYTPLGPVVPLVGDPGGGVRRMAITPDGGTLFIAGGAQIVVQPTPAL